VIDSTFGPTADGGLPGDSRACKAARPVGADSQTLQSAFEKAGFRLSSQGSVEQQLASSSSEYAEKLSLKADSIIASLSLSDFERGMAELRKYASETEGDQPVFETVDFFLFAKVSDVTQEA
jgi:hypothetical protein